MKILRSVAAAREASGGAGSVALVPTMGALHDGHLALVRRARDYADYVVVSIFVNPLQFGPNEDFDRYPRNLPGDIERLGDLADAVFAPPSGGFVSREETTHVEPPMTDILCGAHRPGHFRGVATIVTKLLNVVQPDYALFGRKDYQQFAVVRRVVADLEIPVAVVGVETVRASDGLALSSRNGFLNDVERAEAPRLYHALASIAHQLKRDRTATQALCAERSKELKERGWNVDYIEVREADTLAPVGAQTEAFVVLGAAWLGTTRLIDNIEVRITQ